MCIENGTEENGESIVFCLVLEWTFKYNYMWLGYSIFLYKNIYSKNNDCQTYNKFKRKQSDKIKLSVCFNLS